MKIHFLYVGNGNTIIVEHPSGRISLVDLYCSSYAFEAPLLRDFLLRGPSYQGYSILEILEKRAHEPPPTNPIEYWRNYFGYEPAFRFILTHLDEDHYKGIEQFATEIGFINFWSTGIGIDGLSNSSDSRFLKRLINGEVDGIVSLKLFAGANSQYYGLSNPTWDWIEILYPPKEIKTKEPNIASYILKFHYGNSSLIVSGDAPPSAFEEIFEQAPYKLQCTIFVAPHHGRETSYVGSKILEKMNPLLVIISKGSVDENDDGTQKYRNILGSQRVWTTRYFGNIVLELTPRNDIQSIYTERYTVQAQINLILARILRLKEIKRRTHINSAFKEALKRIYIEKAKWRQLKI